jgi:anti-sigma factor RsiW
VPNSAAHLTEWTIEQLAEGGLPEAELPRAREHLERCQRCASEVEAYRALFTALSDLPRFAPREGFADAVMARVCTAPEPDPVYAWLVERLPKTRRGWTLFTGAVSAPVVVALALAGWLLTHPGVTVSAVWQWAAAAVGQAALGATTWVGQLAITLGVTDGARLVYDTLAAVPAETLVTVIAFIAVATTLSVWSLVRLVRSPTEDVTYAN